MPAIVSRLQHLPVLVPLLGLWLWLSIEAPYSPWSGLNNFHDGRRFSLSHYWYAQPEFTVFDLDRLSFELVADQSQGYVSTHGDLIEEFKVLSRDELRQEYRLQSNLYSHRNKRVERSITNSFPMDASVRLVGQRFLVADCPGQILWLDLRDPDEKWNAFPIARGDESWIVPASGQPAFARSAYLPLPPGSTKPPQRSLELFRFDEQGQLRKLSSWLIRTPVSPSYWDTSFLEQQVASVNAEGTAIEFRSLIDGQFQKVLALDPPIDLSKEEYSFYYNLLRVNEQRRHRSYSLAHEKWLVPPFDMENGSTGAGLDISPDSRVALWSSGQQRRAIVTDCATDQPICSLADPGERYLFLDNDTLLSIDSWLLLTIRLHDLQTGATLLRWRPFWWVLPVLALAIVTSVFWVASWLRIPKPNGLWAWADLHILHIILLTVLVVRIRSGGDVLDTSRLPYQHAIYITSGFLFVAWGWLIFGKGSTLVRLTHLILVYAIVLAALAQTLAADAPRAWMGIALVSIPSLLAIPVWSAIRARSWYQQSRIKSTTFALIKPEPGVESSDTGPESITLKQMMMVTAVFALLALAVRPIMSGWGGMFQLNWPLWEAASIAASGLLSMVLELSARGTLRRLGIGLAAVAALLLILESSSLAIYSAGWWPGSAQQYQIRRCLGFFATVYLASRAIMMSSRNKLRAGLT